MNSDSQWPDFEKEPNAEEFRKLFVGGLHSKTTEESLKEYFLSYGTIESCEIMKDKSNPGKSKGFGFITFSNIDGIDEVQKNRPHEVDGKKIETKRAIPKSQQHWATKKLYVKNFPRDAKEEDLTEAIKDIFGRYGNILSIKLIKDRDSKDGALKGFGFIEFDDEDPVDKCNLLRKFKIKGIETHVSKAYPQDKSIGGRGRGNYKYYEYDMYGPYGYGYPTYGHQYGYGDFGGRGSYGYDFYGGNSSYSRGGGGRPYRGNNRY